MLNMSQETLQEYIHNLAELQFTMTQIGFTQAAGENIRMAEEYLEFMKVIGSPCL